MVGMLAGCSAGNPQVATIRQARQLILYEGLPHQMYETDALNSEMKSKETVNIQGFPFYRETLDLEPEDAEKLQRVLGDKRALDAYSGEKKCGGFHPDYAVEWSHAGQIYRVLICFGCNEAGVYGPKGDAFQDMTKATVRGLKDLLMPYRKNRPAHERFGPLGHDPEMPPELRTDFRRSDLMRLSYDLSA